VKRELCVVNRFYILLLLACLLLTHASRLAAQSFDGKDDHKARNDGPAAAVTDGNPANIPVNTNVDNASAAKEGGNASKDESAAKDESKAKEDVRHDTPGSPIKPGKTMHMDVDLALVNVTVTDPYNRLVTGLDTDNFRVYEDSVEQELVTFSAEDVPISIGVIFDFSGSMANKVAKAREAALQFFKTANPQDEFFLVSFN
jgi:hypothetical protein